MATFYKEQRIKLGILVDKNGNPKGGKWSFDEDNEKITKNIKLPKQISYSQSPHRKN